MPYIKFLENDDKLYRATIMPFRTQHGVEAINIITEDELPVNESGFEYYNDKGQLLGDYHTYRYHYLNNSYAVEPEVINPASGSDAPLPLSPFLQLQNNIAAVSNQINKVSIEANDTAKKVENLTPYTETKTAYIDDTEVMFETDVQGMVLALATNTEGKLIDCHVNREGNYITVSFDKPLEYVTEVTISIGS